MLWLVGWGSLAPVGVVAHHWMPLALCWWSSVCFCAVRREGDKVKQYSRCWSGSPHLISLSSPRAYSNNINMPCVSTCLYVHIFACMYFKWMSTSVCRHAYIEVARLIHGCSAKCSILFCYLLGAECQTDIIAVWWREDISLYTSRYHLSI